MVVASCKVGNRVDIGMDNGRVSDCPPECPVGSDGNGPFSPPYLFVTTSFFSLDLTISL